MFLSDSIITSINKEVWSLLFSVIMPGLFARTYLCPYFHSSVKSSCMHADLCMCEYQFSDVIGA
jgi:hypothetical protein